MTRVLFVADAGPAVGGGHVMRLLTLAAALAGRGAHCAFLAPPPVAAVLDAFAPEMARIPAGDDLAAAARAGGFDAVVFDHYGLGRAEHRAISGGRAAMVIDDLADRPLGADLVLDPGPARTAADYAPLTAPGTPLLLGPRYALVRPGFADRREAALARRGGPVRRVLVSLGLTDLGAITGKVVELIGPALGEAALDVVLGAGAPSLPALRAMAAKDARLTLHVDTAEMDRLAARADIAVGAGGSSSWERCVLGLPTVLLVLADNQRPAADALGEHGAALVLDARAPGLEAALVASAARLAKDGGLRARLSAASSALCDGRGADRAARAFLEVAAKKAGADADSR